MFFHNLVLHGSGPHQCEDFVRWAIDLRYERAPDPTRYSVSRTIISLWALGRVFRRLQATTLRVGR